MQRTCWFGSPVAQLAFWLMIVSIAIAVLPVWRSPAAAALLGDGWGGLVGLHEAVERSADVLRPDRQLSHCSSPVVAHAGRAVKRVRGTSRAARGASAGKLSSGIGKAG